MKKTILGLLLLLLHPVWGIAQEQDDDDDVDYRCEYARMHTIELGGGFIWNLNSYTGLPSLSAGYMGENGTGGFGQIRYTRFLKPQWGLFSSAEVSMLNGHFDQITGSYDYQDQYYYPEDFNHHTVQNRCAQWLAGGVYRWDFANRLSLRSRLGIGYRGMWFSETYFYARWSNALTRPQARLPFMARPDDFEEIQVHTCDMNNNKVNFRGSVAFSPSIQFCYTTHQQMFISLELQWTGTMRRMNERIDVYNVHQTVTSQPYSLDMDFERSKEKIRVVDYEESRQYIIEFDRELKNSSFHRVTMGNYLKVSLGLGWNIGRNHNKTRAD